MKLEKVMLTLNVVFALTAAQRGVEDDVDLEEYDDGLTLQVEGLDEETLRFRIGEEEEENIVMTIEEVNEIFGKKKKKSRKLTKAEKKKARDCRQKKQLYSTADDDCHSPTTQGPCAEKKWFVSRRGKLEGKCKAKPCEEGEVLFKGACQSVKGRNSPCPGREGLLLNIRGFGYCDCLQGFSYSLKHGKCFRELVGGPCKEEGKVWSRREKKVRRKLRKGHKVFGECRSTGCKKRKVRWEDGKCHDVEVGEACLESDLGELELVEGKVTCTLREEGSGPPSLTPLTGDQIVT